MEEFLIGFIKFFVGLFLIVLIPLSIYSLYLEGERWSKFKVEQNCKIVGKSSGSTGVGVSTSGNTVVISNPSKTGWLCDDGITYWK